MARLRRDNRLETRDARARLPQSHDRNGYWRTIERGLSLGYYKGPQGGTWFVRRRQGNQYIKARLALADDFSDSNGTTILSFGEAQRKALSASESLKPREERHYSVAQAIADYLEHLKVRAKSWRDTEVKLKAHVLPKLGREPLAELTPEMIRRWRDGVALTTHDRGGRPRQRKSATASHNDGACTPTGGATASGEFKRSADAATAKAPGPTVAKPEVLNTAEVQRRKQATANRLFSALRACLNHAWREGKVASDLAWRRVPAFRNVDSPVVRFLTRDEARRLVNAADPGFRPLVQAALLTGCRYGELCALRVGDFDFENETLAIRHSKSGRARHVYLTAEGVELFEQLTVGRLNDALIFTHLDGTPWGLSHQHRPMRDACTNAKVIPPISFHVLRHSYASALTKAGVPLQIVASALGHADARMTEKHYSHLAPSHIAKLVRANVPSLSRAPGKRSRGKARKVARLRA